MSNYCVAGIDENLSFTNVNIRLTSGGCSSVHAITKIDDKTSSGRIKRKVCWLCSKSRKRKDRSYRCLRCNKQP